MPDDNQESDLGKYRDTFKTFEKAALISKWCNEHTRIRASIWSSLATAPLIIFCYRMLEASGNISENRVVITPNTDRTVLDTDIRTGMGFLLDCYFTTDNLAVKRGHTFCKAVLRNNKDLVNVAPLCNGYVTNQNLVAWPQGKNEASTEGPGLIRQITGTDPAAGAQVSETVPTNARWRLRAIRITLVTDATAATRRLHLTFDDGTTVNFDIVSATTQIASLTRNYDCADVGQIQTNNESEIYLIFPNEWTLLEAFRIITTLTNGVAGDDFGAPQLVVEEWIEQ